MWMYDTYHVSSLFVVVFFAQINNVVADRCLTELALAGTFGGAFVLLLIAFLLYCCCSRSRDLQQGNARTNFTNTAGSLNIAVDNELEMNDKKEWLQYYERKIPNIEMATMKANFDLSASEEILSINGDFSGTASLENEPKIFVFVKKTPGESLGLYLVPFGEEPLTGLYVKSIDPRKSAASLEVFDPGDKILSVNGKYLRGMTYRESTDFIRECPGPYVNMGIIKHALHTKEDLAKLQSASLHDGRFSAGANVDVRTPDVDLGGSGPINVEGQMPSLPKIDMDASTTKRVVVEDEIQIAKPDVSFNVESTPDDFTMDFGGIGLGEEGSNQFSGEMNGKGMGGKSAINAGNIDIDYSAPSGIFDTDIDEGKGNFKETMSDIENRPLSNIRRKSSKTPRRSFSSPQVRLQRLSDIATLGIPTAKHVRHLSDDRRTDDRERSRPPLLTYNNYAVATPLSESSPDSRSYPLFYSIPLSDEPSSHWFHGNIGMIRSKSLDKLDEIMRNDPILGEDYHHNSMSSLMSIKTQENVHNKSKSRRSRNDRPRSQILPPTYLQVPAVTGLSNSKVASSEDMRVMQRTDYHSPSRVVRRIPQDDTVSFSDAEHRRLSKEEQTQIVQRWINEMVEQKKAEELQRENATRNLSRRQRSTKLKKKSQSVQDHGSRSRKSARRHTLDDIEFNTEIDDSKLRHFGSDPSFKIEMTTDEGRASFWEMQATTLDDGRYSQSKTQSTLGDVDGKFVPDRRNLFPDSTKRLRMSNPDTPLISHLLSGESSIC